VASEDFLSDASFRESVLGGYKYALSLAANKHDAEDLTQEAIARLYRKYGEIRNKGHLYRTIRNLYFDSWRRSKVVSIESIETADRVEALDEEHRTPGGALDVEEALRILRPEERELLYLRYKDGYSAAEIAELIDRARGTVLSALYRAENKMRAHMAEGSQGKMEGGAQ